MNEPSVSMTMCWAERGTWLPWLSDWLGPRLKKGAFARFQKFDAGRLYDDDLEWLRRLDRCLMSDLEYVQEELAGELEGITARTFHGCRTEDAGVYYREGLRLHNRDALIRDFRQMVHADDRLRHLRHDLDSHIDSICSKVDEGRCFVVLDARTLLEDAAHYLIYGSELICALVGEWSRRVLLDNGAPTLIHIDLPLAQASRSERCELAKAMLREWARLQTKDTCEQVISLDFTFSLRRPLPGEWIAGHFHPLELNNPFDIGSKYRSTRGSCKHCETRLDQHEDR